MDEAYRSVLGALKKQLDVDYPDTLAVDQLVTQLHKNFAPVPDFIPDMLGYFQIKTK
ncbi:hypothetical protein [Komagataeibacter xylinus]|uniref:hypothetical protein n=1 Tax=Komagataeibacter xylinus TaxID=28448 RepID=UPI0013EE5D3E|nr:hypothetical protein [Komagataeibacter xylinus]